MALKKCKECGTEISSKATVCPHCGAPQKKKSRLLGMAVLIIVAVVIITAMSVQSPTTGNKPTSSAPPPPPSPTAVALAKVTLKYTWHSGGFGHVMVMRNVIIKNGSQYAFKDPLIRCTMYAQSGTALGDVEKTIYQIVKPRHSLKLSEISMGLMNSQANSASCRIANLVVQ